MVLLIDILNGIHFAGADFLPALEAARKRKRLLNPVLKQVMDYAAKEPQAYRYRFSESLLSCSAYLLSEADEPDFLELAQPLIDAEADPSLLGVHPEDSARLIARSIGRRLPDVISILKHGSRSDEFCTTVFEALLLVAHWSPERHGEVTSTFLGLLRSDLLGLLEPGVRNAVVDSCLRLDPLDFLLDLHIAVGRGDLDEGTTTELISEAGKPRQTAVRFDNQMATTCLTPEDPFLRQYRSIFLAEELRKKGDQHEPDPKALELFNSVVAPARNLLDRFAALPASPELVDICMRVLRFAAASPESFRYQHLPTSVSAAICLGSAAGDEAFTKEFVALLSIPEEHLDRLLGNDLTEMCEPALAVSGRTDPYVIRELVENAEACGVSRSVALDALMRQVTLGYLSSEWLNDYCRDLLSRRNELGKNTWLWPYVVNVCARLALVDQLPILKQMVHEGFFTDEGGEWYDDESLDQKFRSPDELEIELGGVTALDLLRLSSIETEHRRVREFLGCLEPPRYQDAGEVVE